MRKIFILLLPVALAAGCTSYSAGQDISEDAGGVNTYNHDANNTDSLESGSDADDNGDEDLETDKEKYADMLDELEEELASLEEKAEDGTHEEMEEAEDELYERWDVALNEIYDALENELSGEAMDDLRDEQQEWIDDREEYGEDEASENEGEGGSHDSFAVTEAKKEYTKERCYDLIDDYME